MSDLHLLIKDFTGVDPIAGTRALGELVGLGDRGEEALFEGPIAYPNVMQVRRRWLHYVASRADTISGRLLDRLCGPKRFNDAHAAAYLCAGLGSPDALRNELFKQLDEGLTYDSYYDFASRYEAWGYAGGDASALWHRVSKDHFKWEKLRTFAFRAGCASCARVRAGDQWALEQLITHQWEDYRGLGQIKSGPDEPESNDVIDGAEMAMQAIQVFSTWRRGDVADEILRRWSAHQHWRVRSFGAQILAALGFQRTVTPVLAWLRREPTKSIRVDLLHALERSRTAAGADALVAFFADQGEGGPYVGKAAWRSTDKAAAQKALEAIAAGTGPAAGEALVSLARLGHGQDSATNALDSHDNYLRLNAALALAYLQERATVKRLVSMQREASVPIERVFLAAALAILGQPNAAQELHRQLVAAAGEPDVFKRLDVFFVHNYLQEAVIDALTAGGAQTELLDAWRAELEALEPLASPVDVRIAPAAPPPAFPGSANQPIPPEAVPAPVKVIPRTAAASARAALKVFVSYSHADEKMRKKLGAHLAPLVTEDAIKIWHDRQIEAGADWDREINREIDEADLILLLVSATFLDSPYCRKELLRALARRKANKASTVPIILRPCDWQSVFNAKDYKAQALPRDNRPVAGGKWPNQDAAYAQIAKELRTVVERLRQS
jgi:hypothetical protein